MLSIGKLGAGQEGYYLDAVAKGIDEYYTVRGEVAGRWTGSGITGHGFQGRVDANDLRAVLAGVHPVSGEQLASSQRKVWAFDLTFSAPKSVSVLHAFGSWEAGREVAAAHELAVDAALGYLEREALFSRRGHGGVFRVATEGLTAAAFRHRTSRSGDPQLHTHVLVANLVQGTDGRWGTLDARPIYRHAKTAGFLYQAHLRAELAERLGVAWLPARKGSGELAGIPQPVLEVFSQRRAEITGVLREQGESSRGAAQLATLVTRDEKRYPLELRNLLEDWTDRAAVLGFGQPEADQVLDREPSTSAQADRRSLGDELTWEHSTFDRRDVLRALAGRATQGARIGDLTAAADTFVEGPDVVTLGAGRWTTPDMLSIEVALINNALGRQACGSGLTGDRAIAGGLAADDALSVEQVAMVRHLTTSGDGVEVVVGVAGAGKTRALAAAVHAWRAEGYRVIGTALAARTAKHLGAETGAAPFTVTRLLQDLDTHGAGELSGSVLIVDEAGMVGTRHLARLAAHVNQAHAKLVLVGDPRQLPEIEAGGAFAALAQRLDANILAENHRQRDSADRRVLAHLRAGNAEQAVDQIADAGRITITDTADQARARMVDDWLVARDNHAGAIMLACRRGDVAKLNATARAALVDHGDVQPDGITTPSTTFGVGDRVMTLRNHYPLGLTNGETGTVVTIDERNERLVFKSDDGRDVAVPADYLHDGHLAHAYATTIHKAQGLTADTALVLADDALFQEAAYTALSRGRTRNQLYIVGPDVEQRDEAHAPEHDRREPLQALLSSLARSEAKELAVVRRPARPVAAKSPEPPDTGIDLGW